MELNNKQIKLLRSKAAVLSANWQIGKGGVTDNMIANLTDYIRVHSIAKIKILQNSAAEKRETAEILAKKTRGILVQIIGRQIILFRPVKGHELTDQVNALR